MTRKIDYFFGIGSPWAYLGLDAFEGIAALHGTEIEPHVIPLIEENGGVYSRDRPPSRRGYWMEELRRWAYLRGVPLSLEGRDALADPAPAGRLVVAARLAGQDWLGLTRALQEAFWSAGENIGAPGVGRGIAERLGFDGAALEAEAASEAVDARLSRSRRIAKEAGVFGLPTYSHGGALFWGQDSLPFLERQLRGERLTA